MRLDKHYNNANLEARRQDLLRRQQADNALRKYKVRKGSVRGQVDAAFAGGPTGDLGARLEASLKNADSPDAYKALVGAVVRSRLLEDGDYLGPLFDLAQWHRHWVRPPADWRPRSHNARRQFSSLARHLLARYPVPAFMDEAWLDRNRRPQTWKLHQAWFVHVGSGQNIRTAGRLPVPLTKRMAHEFLLAPDDYTVQEALRWGQIRGTGGDERLARALVGSRLGTRFFTAEQEAFWATVLNFFVLHPMIDPHQVGPIIDYLHNQKFVAAGVVNVNGTFVNAGPPQPGLSMKGRTPDALLAQVQSWHRRLARVPQRVVARDLRWEPCGIPGLDRVEGEPGRQRRFVVSELLSGPDLYAEGAEMRHCVFSYAHSCHSGRVAIFSLQAQERGVSERRLTVEVNLGTRQIVQARGKCNKPSTPLDQRVLSIWASVAGLTFGRYALTRAY